MGRAVVGLGVFVGSVVGFAVGAGVAGGGGAVVGPVAGSPGAGVSPLGVPVRPAVGSPAAGGMLGLTAVLVLDGAGDADGDATPGVTDDGGVPDGALDAGGSVGDGSMLGDWPTAVLPLG